MKKNENYLFAQPDGWRLYEVQAVCDSVASSRVQSYIELVG